MCDFKPLALERIPWRTWFQYWCLGMLTHHNGVFKNSYSQKSPSKDFFRQEEVFHKLRLTESSFQKAFLQKIFCLRSLFYRKFVMGAFKSLSLERIEGLGFQNSLPRTSALSRTLTHINCLLRTFSGRQTPFLRKLVLKGPPSKNIFLGSFFTYKSSFPRKVAMDNLDSIKVFRYTYTAKRHFQGHLQKLPSKDPF